MKEKLPRWARSNRQINYMVYDSQQPFEDIDTIRAMWRCRNKKVKDWWKRVARNFCEDHNLKLILSYGMKRKTK